MVRPIPAIEAIPSTTPFVGPEQLMRETGRGSLVRLGANESAFGPSPRAIDAMRAQLPHLSWYGDPESLDLRDALAAAHGCDPAQIVVGSGIDDLMGLAVRAYVGLGGRAVTTRGTYPTLNYHVIGYGGELLEAPYGAGGVPDLDALLHLARERSASLLYLANPDNPSGTFLERGEIARLCDALPDGTLLLLDEAYADYVEPARLPPLDFDDRVVRARTFSKAYGMAGARIGYVLAARSIAQVFQKIRLHYGVNRNAQIGALAALGDDAFLRQVVCETARARDDYYAIAQELGCGYLRSHTNFACIDMENAQRASRVMNDLLREHGVWIRKPGLPPLDRYIRVSAGLPDERRAFAAALRAVLSYAGEMR